MKRKQSIPPGPRLSCAFDKYLQDDEPTAENLLPLLPFPAFLLQCLAAPLGLLMEMRGRKRPPCLAAQSAVLSLARSLFSQAFCLSCLLGAVSEMRS